jgi:hypothetical protein
MEHAQLTIEAPRRYVQPKPIPQELSAATSGPVTEPTVPAAKPSPADMIVGAALDKFVKPAVSLGTVGEYVDFWKEHAGDFNSLLVSLSLLHKADAALNSRAINHGELRTGFVEGCIRSARFVGGEDGERTTRWALSDCLAAYGIVEGFSSPKVVESPEDDKAARVYNAAMRLLDPLLVCVFEAPSVHVNRDLVSAVTEVPALVAHQLLKAARTGAQVRGLPSAFKLATILPAWDGPDEAFLDYLREREPSLVTEDLVALCGGRSNLTMAIEQIARGEVRGGAGECRVSEAPPDQSITAWANALAADLARLED